MKARIPLLVQDQTIAQQKGMRLTEDCVFEGERFFLDGPVSERLAVLDFDLETGVLATGTRFKAAEGTYEVDEQAIESPDFLRTNAFATALRTMYMFEESDTLGRPLRWGFDGPQLLIVPVAGEWANAFYERESRSLQFYFFPSKEGRRIYTSLSHDIVSHETGHAILDGIAPDLYHAITPQSLALHEGIADLVALVMAFRNDTLRKTVLDQTGGSIANITAFSSVAEEFGQAQGKPGGLRQFVNEKTLDPKDTENAVDASEPHELSQVLTGALYSVMVRIHETLKRRFAQEDGTSDFSASGKALFVGAERFKRMIFRALDYLPPGEISFADYGRAIIASDQASHPDAPQGRDWLRDEFVRRRMAANVESLEVEEPFPDRAVKTLDLETFVESDWAAYDFANRNRELLRIPPEIPFRVRPRLDTSKTYYFRGGVKKPIRECVFKVSWDELEPNPKGSWFPDKRQITVGTTLAIDWETKQVRARLTSRWEEQRKARDLMLQRLDEKGLLVPAQLATTPDGKPLRCAIKAETSGELMRVRGTARMLHIAEA
jgi:hypothetical protein